MCILGIFRGKEKGARGKKGMEKRDFDDRKQSDRAFYDAPRESVLTPHKVIRSSLFSDSLMQIPRNRVAKRGIILCFSLPSQLLFFPLFLWLPFFMNSRLRRSEDHRKAPTVEASKREFLINGRVNPSLRIVLISRGGTVTVVVNIRRGTAPFPARFFTSSVVSSNPMLTTIQTTMDRIIHNWYIDLCMQRTS